MQTDIAKIIDFYGLDSQLDQTVEECAELIQAINKMKRARKSDKLTVPEMLNLIEELADVQIMTDQLIYFLNCEKVVNEFRKAKIERQLERIGRGVIERAE